jgi:hypothetical protein
MVFRDDGFSGVSEAARPHRARTGHDRSDYTVGFSQETRLESKLGRATMPSGFSN